MYELDQINDQLTRQNAEIQLLTEKLKNIGKHTNKVISDLKLEICGKDHKIACWKHKCERMNNLKLPSPGSAKPPSIKSATTNIIPEPMPIFEHCITNFKNRSDASKFAQLPNSNDPFPKQANVLT